MIRTAIRKKDGRITGVKVSGHAEMGDEGTDLICAGVSAIMFGICNALDRMDAGCEIHIGDNEITISDKEQNEAAQVVLKTCEIQLKTVEEVYSEFIEITEV